MRITRRVAMSAIAIGGVGAVVRAAESSLEPGLCGSTAVDGFDPFCFTDSIRRPHQVYVADGGGPPVMLLHELPGLIDADLCAARRVAKEGYTVVTPLLFGSPGGEGHALKFARTFCDKDQFACNSGELTSPHVQWLRELVVDVRKRWPSGNGVGVIGMCLTAIAASATCPTQPPPCGKQSHHDSME